MKSHPVEGTTHPAPSRAGTAGTQRRSAGAGACSKEVARRRLCLDPADEEPSAAHPLQTVELWRRCAEGTCQEAWGALIEAVVPWLRSSAGKRLRRLPEASCSWGVDDVVQDVLLRLLQADRRLLRRVEFRHEGQIRRYLDKMVESRIHDLLRRRRAAGVRRSLDRGALDSADLICETPTPYRVADARHELRSVCRDLTTVVERSSDGTRTRRILGRLWFRDHPTCEIAAAEGLSVDAVYALHHRCRRALREGAVQRATQIRGVAPGQEPRKP